MDKNTLFAEAVLGRDADEFLSTELGRYLLGRIDIEIETAVNQLKSVHPWRRKRIQALQNEIWRAESVKNWLEELIIEGRNAEQTLEDHG